MRPLRLEIEGFTAFRERVDVDFAGADLFALVGPTGAGKSSLIDAMCLALYGTVPRLDRRMVEPVVSAGALEARVRFDFSVGNERFTAVRVIRRLARGGATTREARLESGDRVVAGDADGVTRGVEELLGLRFEQFTRCVVLPQGEFARFLHDKPRERQDLLVRLLELDVYERMRAAAGQRAMAAHEATEVLGAQRERLAADPEAVQAAGRRVADLTGLRERVEAAAPELAALQATAAQAEQARDEAAARAELLSRITIPPGVADLGVRLEQVEKDLAAADAACEGAQERLVAARADREELPAAGELERVRGLHAQRGDLMGRIGRGEPLLAEALRAESAAADQEEEARVEAAKAEQALQRLRDAHAAHALAAELVPGQPCPVCRRDVTGVPALQPPEDLGRAEERLRQARAQAQVASAAARAAERQRAGYAQRLEGLREQLVRLEVDLEGLPDETELRWLTEQVAAADDALRTAEQHQREAAAHRRSAARKAEVLRAERDGAWRVFDAARDAVAALGPPPVDRNELSAAWSQLAAWAATEQPRRQADADAHAARARQAADERQGRQDALVAACAEASVTVADPTRLRDAVTDALAQAQGEHRRLVEAVTESDRLRAEEDRRREEATVARTLSQHLAANRFERWLLDEALQRLAAGASGVLRELSAGAYSLAVDEQRNFAVVDHRNADERRPARTLSGGETFLASLALALTLAEHLTDMATAAAPRLESIFLDEGFGTLDSETLDTVAAAIEELGSSGRAVGIVTHVRDLAERVPVRFEVRKGPVTSVVQRVDV